MNRRGLPKPSPNILDMSSKEKPQRGVLGSSQPQDFKVQKDSVGVVGVDMFQLPTHWISMLIFQKSLSYISVYLLGANYGLHTALGAGWIRQWPETQAKQT